MKIAIISGSTSDSLLVDACEQHINSKATFTCTREVISAHRDLKRLLEYVDSLDPKQVKVIIGIAGMAAALPGVIAAHTKIPVIGVPADGFMGGLDALLSMCQMPKGVPVATMGVGKAGAINAAELALRIVAGGMVNLKDQVNDLTKEQCTELLGLLS